LRKKGVDPPEVDDAIVRLEELGLVDDSETARAWVRDRLNFAPRGSARLRQELRAQGVDGELVERVLGELLDREAELEAALAVVRKAARRGAGDDEEARRRRLWATLGRRGFDPDVCREALRRHFDEE
jgi:regulatory protein